MTCSMESGARWRRFARYVAQRGWMHLVLLSGTAIFLFPFVWMIATSVKTDEELAGPNWWPQVPAFRAESPYARPAIKIIRPTIVEEATWTADLPALMQAAVEAVNERLRHRLIAPATMKSYPGAAASVLVNRFAPRLPRDAWIKSPADLSKVFAAMLSDADIDAALDDRLASLEFRGIQIRALDARVINIADGAAIARSLKVESGPAKVLAGDDSAVIQYAFDHARKPIVLRYDFDFPIKPADLHKLILSFRPDDSWHRMDVSLDVGSARWHSDRPTYLAQNRPQSAIFQPPSYDDETMQPKDWIGLRKQEQAASGMGQEKNAQATLRIIITPISTAGAVWAKLSRNYLRAFYSVPFWSYVVNSLLLVALTTIGTLFSSTFVAYAFARLNWPGRSAAFVLVLATMMLPAQVTMVPSFLIWRKLGWYNTLNPLWAPAFFGSAFFIFLMTQQMKTIPRELEEAAKIDGLNAVQSWYYVIVPQLRPAAAAVAIMTFMWSWNEFLGPLVYLRDQSRFPLSLGLFAMRLEHFGDWSMIMAGNVLMTLPVIVIFFLCQRYFIEGMAMSGMKG